jgi:hypothetical protein
MGCAEEKRKGEKLGGEVKGASEYGVDHARRDATRWAGRAGHLFLPRMEISAQLVQM